MKNIKTFREKIIKKYPRAWYANLVHFPLFIFVLLVIICTLSFFLTTLLWWHWLVIPFAFLVSNFVEYVMHRFPMHRPIMSATKEIYERHTIDHHLYFQNEHMYIKTWDDFSAVPAPWKTGGTFLVIIAAPLSFFFGLLLGLNAGILFFMVALSYYLFYEITHLLIHLSPTINRLVGKTHTIHHRTRDMRFYNFNVVFPLMDILFGTHKSD